MKITETDPQGNVIKVHEWSDPELEAQLAEARKEWKRLEQAGTPFWCIHEGRDVTHPAAYWKEDGYHRADGIRMQYKHGVICGDCGGYLQEG